MSVALVSAPYLALIAGVTATYWALPERHRLGFLTAASLASLGFASLPALAAFLGLAVLMGAPLPWRLRAALIAGGFLAYKAFIDATGVVWLGVSYAAMRALHYVFEDAKGAHLPHGALLRLGYLCLLPTLACGPIHRFADFGRDDRRRRWDAGRLSLAAERVLVGYFKVVVLATWLVDTRLAFAIDQVDASRTALREYLGCVEYGAHLYLQFSGYSDVAIGWALALGFRVPENFERPFAAPNLAEYWRRWHMSLSSWCREYVYLPVAAQTRSAGLGVLASMIVLAVWHELSFRFLAWGCWHAAGIVVAQALARGERPSPTGLRRALGTLATLNWVIIGFVFTKEPTISAGFAALLRLLGGT